MKKAWPGELRAIGIRGMAIAIFLVVIPLATLTFSDLHPALLGPVIGATFILQAGAVGLAGMGGHPILSFTGIVSVGLAFILIEFDILDALSTKSERVARWIRIFDEKARRISLIERFGMYTLVPLMWIPGIGLYGGVIIAWLFGWDRRHAILLMFSGWIIACTAVLLVVLGLFRFVIR
jgi:uncharacterized membrane protein